MECHKCPTAADIQAGRYKTKTFDEIPCSKCSLNTGANHHGRSHVAVFSAADPVESGLEQSGEDPIDRIFDFEKDPDLAPPPDEGDLVVAAIAYLAKEILTLAPRTREIVLDRLAYPGRPLRLVAARIGISISSTHNRLKKARKDWPALEYALAMKTWTNDPPAESPAFSDKRKQKPTNQKRRRRPAKGGNHDPVKKSAPRKIRRRQI